jgi:amidohydrolase
MISSFPVPNSLNCPQIRLAIRSLQPQLVHWRRQIHQKPELGFQEHLTASLISQTLTKYGIEHQTGIAGTGIVATIEGSQPGPVLALRADMDALPIAEENQVPYCSQHPGQMHACGHDGHTAIALGTAVHIAQNRHHVKGKVKIIFQPAEEGPGGAKPMIEAGVLKNPDVDGIIGLHLWNNLPLGTVGVKNGPLTVDSLLVAAQIVNALQTIVARNLNPLDAAVVTVGKLAAGTARNVIADSANLSGTVRYFNPQLGGYFRQRMEEIIAGICQSQGASYQFDYWQLYPPVINHDQMAELVRSIAAQVVETPAGIVPECQTMGGEDMSFFLQEVPGCYFFLGSANPELGLAYPHHHPRFDFDESVLAMGVEIFVRCVEKFGNSKTF